MIKVLINNVSSIKGAKISVRVVCKGGHNYDQLQLDIFNVGVLNPSFQMGGATKPKQIDSNIFGYEIDTSSLRYGEFEIRYVCFHTTKIADIPPKLEFESGKDFQRPIFEVRPAVKIARSAQKILSDVATREQKVKRSFCTPKNIGSDPAKTSSKFRAFVFVKNLLIGTKMRLDHYEISPTDSGLDVRDYFSFVNEHLSNQIGVSAIFNYDDQVRSEVQQDNPVAVVHFPVIIASKNDEVRDYCVELTNQVLLGLALMRGSGGEVFDVVVVEIGTGQGTKYGYSNRYTGNCLTGFLAGEQPDSLNTYVTSMRDDPFNLFLAELYRQALIEASMDFQIVRFWQILEVLAENRNFEPEELLYNVDGSAIMEGDKQRTIRGSRARVFSLFKESGFAFSGDIWNDVSIWFALRCAVVHFGSTSKYKNLRSKANRQLAEVGFKSLQTENGRMQILSALKDYSRVFLMRKLTQTADTSIGERE